MSAYIMRAVDSITGLSYTWTADDAPDFVGAEYPGPNDPEWIIALGTRESGEGATGPTGPTGATGATGPEGPPGPLNIPEDPGEDGCIPVADGGDVTYLSHFKYSSGAGGLMVLRDVGAATTAGASLLHQINASSGSFPDDQKASPSLNFSASRWVTVSAVQGEATIQLWPTAGGSGGFTNQHFVDGSKLLEYGVLNGVDVMGFFAAPPVARPTGVAVSAAAIHAALVLLGLIEA